jgi:hypothetical protein
MNKYLHSDTSETEVSLNISINNGSKTFIFPVHGRQVGYGIIPCFLDWMVGMWGAVNEKFDCKAVDDKDVLIV